MHDDGLGPLFHHDVINDGLSLPTAFHACLNRLHYFLGFLLGFVVGYGIFFVVVPILILGIVPSFLLKYLEANSTKESKDRTHYCGNHLRSTHLHSNPHPYNTKDRAT